MLRIDVEHADHSHTNERIAAREDVVFRPDGGVRFVSTSNTYIMIPGPNVAKVTIYED